MVDDLDQVWRALAEPTRRAPLDHLRDGPRTTGQLVHCFPGLTRFAVMKHLNVLEDAGLLIVKRSGRERWNYLNAVPLRQIYERWMGPYAELWSSSLLRLKEHVERDQPLCERKPESGHGVEPLLPQLRRRKGA